MSAEIPTPRTDAKESYEAGYYLVTADFARQLERELAAVKSSLDAANQREAGLREALEKALAQYYEAGQDDDELADAAFAMSKIIHAALAAIRSEATGGVEKGQL